MTDDGILLQDTGSVATCPAACALVVEPLTILQLAANQDLSSMEDVFRSYPMQKVLVKLIRRLRTHAL
eukprot:6471722-Amphidinium_carterae.2